jgi:hypothetical protein
MKKLFVSTAISLLLVTLITGMVLAALPHTEVSGSFTSASTTVHNIMEDKFNEVIDLSSTVIYSGILEGTSTLQGTLTVRRDGSANFLGRETFTGSVNGIPGTLTFKVTGTKALYRAIQLTNVITSGTGGLASFHGELSKTRTIEDNALVGTYTGQINNQ